MILLTTFTTRIWYEYAGFVQICTFVTIIFLHKQREFLFWYRNHNVLFFNHIHNCLLISLIHIASCDPSGLKCSTGFLVSKIKFCTPLKKNKRPSVLNHCTIYKESFLITPIKISYCFPIVENKHQNRPKLYNRLLQES